jgi:hypothetical protein
MYIKDQTVSQPRRPQSKMLEPVELNVPTTNQQIASWRETNVGAADTEEAEILRNGETQRYNTY